MNMFNKLPYFVNLQEKKYKINVDFRNMISFENKIQEFLIRNTELYREACEKLLWFYKCGRENYHKIKSGNKGCLKSNEIYSYEYDDEYIWGAFFELYKIDLTTDKLHWWKFKAILNSLPENTKFEKIKSYRAYNGKDKEMLELKDYWKLPLPFKEQERLDRIYELLK